MFRFILASLLAGASIGAARADLGSVYGPAFDAATDVLRSSSVQPSGSYVVPAGTTLIIDSVTSVYSLSVEGGTVLWDTAVSDLILR